MLQQVQYQDPKDYFRRLKGLEVWSLLSRTGNFLGEQGIGAYLVGGFVRNVLLGRETADIDIAVASDALEIAPQIASALGGKYVPLDKVNRVGRVVLADWQLDFSTFKSSIEADLARRDFTIDAMAVNISQFGADNTDIQVIDPFHGREDLNQKVIRVVAESAFSADTARLLRAVRLAAELDFTIEGKTEALIRQFAPLVANLSGERVREELLRLLAINGGQTLTYLDKLGLLTALFPELEATKGIEQPKEHLWDVFNHLLQTVSAVDFLLRQSPWSFQERAGEEILALVPWSAELAEHFKRKVSSGSTRRSLLKLAALLHDVSKPETKTLDAGRIRFLGHAKEGATVTANRLERLRFTNKEIKLVETEIRHHLRPVQMSPGGLPSLRATYRYFRDTGEASIDILFLNLADHLAARGPNLNLTNWREHTGLIAFVIGKYFEQGTIVRPARLVDGHDIINIFGIAPGPRIGEILEKIHEAQASGEVTTREEALAYIDHLLTSPPEGSNKHEIRNKSK
ncbi:MAG: HD domain-containing protein [Dehalococcoidales bacterium]|nr:HD domain-containing protein [Dehalococcoidales bacterium]